MKALIITADDFGLSPAVNEAVEQAHRCGVLGTASLMAGGPAAGDAVERASRLPSLRIGLHIVLTGLAPVSPAAEIPGLLGPEGKLSSRLLRSGLNFYFRPPARRQLEHEIRAQFELFRKYGLALDHVNCHRHLHLHPAVFDLVAKVGAGYGMKAVRLPYEPYMTRGNESRFACVRRFAWSAFLFPWTSLLRHKIRRSGLFCNDYVFGLTDTGRMEAGRVFQLLRNLPDGVSEMYFHPATRSCPELRREAPRGRHVAEFTALVDAAFGRAMADLKIKQIGFGDLPLRLA